MKTLLKVSLCSLMIFMAGCEKDRVIFTGPYFVRFTETTGFEKESYTGEIKIEVHNAGPAIDEDVNVSYSIGGTARQDIDYEILDDPKTVTIPAGEYFGYIRIRMINNANNILRSQTIVLTILTTGQNDLEVGQGASAIGKTYTYTIFDDCILGGTYQGKRTGGSTNYPDLSITSTDCINYTLSNWNLGVFSSSVEMDLKFVDNGDNTLTVPEQEESTIDPTQATIFGAGVVDPTTKQITLKITLKDFENQPEASITLNTQ